MPQVPPGILHPSGALTVAHLMAVGKTRKAATDKAIVLANGQGFG
jgi:hypothetical protein